MQKRTNGCLNIYSMHSFVLRSCPPSLGQLETKFIRFVLLLFSLPTASFPPSLAPPIPLTVVIGSAGIIQRLDIIYCLPCTITPPTFTPFLNRTRCPADELIILEILFLLLIPPFYEQLLFFLWCDGFNPCLVLPSSVCKRQGGVCVCVCV